MVKDATQTVGKGRPKGQRRGRAESSTLEKMCGRAWPLDRTDEPLTRVSQGRARESGSQRAGW